MTKILGMTTGSTNNFVLRCIAWVYNPTEPFVPPKEAFCILKTLVALKEVGFAATFTRNVNDPSNASLLTLAAFFASVAADKLQLESPPLLPASVHNQFCAYFGPAADCVRIKQVSLGLRFPVPPENNGMCCQKIGNL